MIYLVKSKFAKLEPAQLEELIKLEEKLEVTLLAYDHFVTEEQSQESNNTNTINPS